MKVPHVFSGRGETFLHFGGVITLQGHTGPRVLDPDPSFVVVVGGFMLA